MSARYLLLGGGTFVGRTLLRTLTDEGAQVDVLNRGLTLPARFLPDGARHLAADRGDREAVRAALRGRTYDAVFDISGYQPREIEAVFDALDDRAGHYVYISTVVVYAQLWRGDATAPLPEHAELLDPHGGEGDDYSRAKRACELAVLGQRRIPATVLRPCGIYGVGDTWYRHDYFFDRIARDRPVLVPDSHVGRTVHHTSVEGLADLCLTAARRDARYPLVLNAADAEPTTCDTIAAVCARAADEQPRVRIYPADLPATLLGADRVAAMPRARFPYGREPAFSLDCTAAVGLGWKPRDLADGSAALWRDYAQRHRHTVQQQPDFRIDDAVLAALGREASSR